MDSLGNIIDKARDGGKPDYDDLRYAVCALDSLMTFDRMALLNLVEAERKNKKKILSYSAEFQWTERFNRLKNAYEKPPKEWLGKNNDPDSPKVQERRRKSIELVNKIHRKNEKNRNMP